MPRTPRRVAVVLVLGLVTSLVVAWACCIFPSRTFHKTGLSHSEAERAGQAHFQSRYPIIHGYLLRAPGFHRLVVITELEDFDNDVYRFRSFNRIRSGWPIVCLEGQWRETEDWTSVETAWLLPLFQRFGPLELPNPIAPLKPLWIGFALNTALYGAAFWIVGVVFYAWRRRVRLSRGCCYACGYNLKGALSEGDGDVTCSECGEVIDRNSLTSLHRPVLQVWMLPFALPVLVLSGASFISLIDWQWLRIQLLYNQSLFTPGWILSWLVATLFTSELAMRAYRDRPRHVRILLAVTVSLVLASISLLCIYILLVGRGP